MDKFELEVISALRELEVPMHMKGYRFIKTALNVLRKDPNAIFAVIKLYGTVAEREGSTASRVERGIRHALGSADSDFMTQKKVLGTSRELTNGEFLATLHEAINVKVAGVA